MKHTTHVQPTSGRTAPVAGILSRPLVGVPIVTGLLLLAMMALLTLTGVASPLNAQQIQNRAILGTIYNIDAYGEGLTVITVQDQAGEQLQLEVRDELTIIQVPGRERSLAKNLEIGSTIAAIAQQRTGVTNVNTATDAELQGLSQIGPARSQAIVNFRITNGYFGAINDLLQVPGITQAILDSIRSQIVVNDWIQAQHIMAKPSRAVLHFHITGVVVQISPAELTVLDADGNRITLGLTLGGASGISPGEPVTVAVRHDPKLGTYMAVDIDRVRDALQRLVETLTLAEQVGDAQNIANLRLRLVDAVGRVNAALEQAVERAPFVRQNVQAAIGDLQTILRAFDLYGPVVTVTGVVDLVDAPGGFLGITDETGNAIDLRIAPETVIRDGDMDINLNQELFGRRVRVTYDPNPSSLRTHRVELVRDTGLPSHILTQLAATANEGEAEGTVVELRQNASPQYITLRLDDGSRLPLTVQPGTGYYQGLGSFYNSRVAVRYDTYSFELQYIQRSPSAAGETPIAGVIRDLDLKESREIDVAVPGGTVLTLTWVSNSQLTRDSLPINPSDINVGDVVRPTSSYLASDVTFLAVRKLDLISPIASIQGPVLGVDANAGRVTVLPESGQIVTIQVGDSAVMRDGSADILESLQPGERLGLGSFYNPLTSEAWRVVIQPAKALRVAGTIADLDFDDFIITLTPDGGGDNLTLLVPNKPRIVTVGGDNTASFHSLRVGNRVDNLIYRYDDNVVVELMVSSR